jgi:hypothetical protein
MAAAAVAAASICCGLQIEMWQAVQAQRQPDDAALRHPSGSAKAVSKLPAQRSKQAAAATEEGSKVATKLKRQRNAAGTAAPKAAGRKRRKTGKRNKGKASEEDEDSEEGADCSEDYACGDEAPDSAAAAAGSDEDELELQHPQCEHRPEGRRQVKKPAKFR